MMMPANYSAIAENEMTYVVGGGLVDCLAPVMNDKNWQNFNTNLISIVGSSFASNFINDTLATVFSGTYQPGQVVTNLWNHNVNDVWNANFKKGDNFWAGAKGALNVALRGVAGLATIYTLGQGTLGYNGAKAFTVAKLADKV